MGTLASLLVKIGADISGLTKGLDEAEGKTEKTSANVSKSASKTAAAFGRIGDAMTVGVTLPVLAFGAMSVKAANDSESAMAELNAVIKSTGGAAGVTAKSVTDYASEMQRMTKFSDDAIISGTSMLLTFTKIGKDVMPLAQDALGLTAAQLAANPQQAGSNALSRETRKSVLQNQLGSTLTQTLDADASITARAYYGQRENTQYQTGLATSTGAWVGLDSAYYGLGLQYNRSTQIAGYAVQWVAGYEWDHQGSTRQGGAAVLGQQTSTTRNEFDQAGNSDFFVQARTQLSQDWAMVAGLRLSSVQLSSTDHYLSDGNGSGSETFRANTPVLGLSYRVSEALNFFANVGRGFESPTLNEVAYDGTGVPAFNTSVQASSSQQFEFGAKWAPTPQSRVDVTAFQVDSKNEIVVASSSGGNSTYKNAPGTSRSGVELSASAQLTPHVSARLAASWIDATYSQAFASGASNVALGNRIPGVPQNFLFSELLWSEQGSISNAKKAPLRGAQAGLELTQTGRLYANDANTASAPGHTVLNARVGYGWVLGAGRLSLFSRIDNLNNQHYVGSVIVNQASSQFYEPAPGRNWIVGLRGALPL